MEVATLEREITELRVILHKKEEELSNLKEKIRNVTQNEGPGTPRWAIERYSRQALLHEIGSSKETISKLMRGSVLIVGVGGLGCPAAVYLAGAGVGHIGLVDYDDVELTNLHRQPLHSEATVSMKKVRSAAITLRRLNSNIKITAIDQQLSSVNALEIIRGFDVVVDATDNAVTRYLLNDACVMSQKPLVSAAALQLSGQFTVYNYPPKIPTPPEDYEQGPCYRCLFPTPPPPEAMGSCSQNGVLGPVPGVMGCLQAIESIMILLGKSSIAGSLLLFDGTDSTFTKVKLRKRNPNCAVCSENPSITELIDYEEFCQSLASDKELKLNILNGDERISALEFSNNHSSRLKARHHSGSSNLYESLRDSIESDSVLIDVRLPGEFEMCSIENSVNCPIDKFDSDALVDIVKDKNLSEVYFVCRRGNDSQIAVERFKNKWTDKYVDGLPVVKDIDGGLHSWAKNVDDNFPIY